MARERVRLVVESPAALASKHRMEHYEEHCMAQGDARASVLWLRLWLAGTAVRWRKTSARLRNEELAWIGMRMEVEWKWMWNAPAATCNVGICITTDVRTS